ncbi:post-GPI attachment to proteins factor 2-like [Schistocerca serialis cubense]|uniref:post-GPI attachment to proteins factor 2-like n=1 Tax=Schistocerca serialis cubense TaxID=2023355 RepID=UPI00214F288A|nr:post-GPI attachment to proteins factor 2-like [Schistocerca serialis cubense]
MEGNSICNRAAVVFLISFRQLCLVTVSLPLCALLICFVTAYIFQQDDIHETHCRVYNVIPSISAITGISPQRYLWRTCIAFHIGPRVIIASVYKIHYRYLLSKLYSEPNATANRLLNLCYWLNMLEIGALCGVTYVSNRENYPAHEKIFITFMIGSLSYMLVTLKVFKMVKPTMTESERRSYFMKKVLFGTSICSTAGLLVFFLKHRLLCHEMAFSWFSLCEYIIACANMAFHFTVVMDFPTENLVVIQGSSSVPLPLNSVDSEQKVK